jgi:hypothetical protein
MNPVLFIWISSQPIFSSPERVDSKSVILEWRLSGHGPALRRLTEVHLSVRVISFTWHPKFFKECTARQQMCLGMSRDSTGVFVFSRQAYTFSFGMTILETASNIVVPDQ